VQRELQGRPLDRKHDQHRDRHSRMYPVLAQRDREIEHLVS
jgi:hypothetical protein